MKTKYSFKASRNRVSPIFFHAQTTIMRYTIFLFFFLAGCISSKPFTHGKTWEISNNTLTVGSKSFPIERLINFNDREMGGLPSSYLVYTNERMFVCYLDSTYNEIKIKSPLNN